MYGVGYGAPPAAAPAQYRCVQLFSWSLAASMRSKEKDKCNSAFVELQFHDKGGLFLSF